MNGDIIQTQEHVIEQDGIKYHLADVRGNCKKTAINHGARFVTGTTRHHLTTKIEYGYSTNTATDGQGHCSAIQTKGLYTRGFRNFRSGDRIAQRRNY